MGTLYTKLASIQNELKAPKGQYNSFGKYNYRSCEDILEAVKPILNKHGVSLLLSDHIENVGDRYYVEAEATISDGTESISVTASAREDESKKGMDGAQITGAASSYARKYALNGLFCIDDTKDADTDSYTKQTKPAEPKYLCDNCGSLIKDAGGATAAQIAKATKAKYGKCICKPCLDEIKKAQDALKNNGEIPVEVHE